VTCRGGNTQKETYSRVRDEENQNFLRVGGREEMKRVRERTELSVCVLGKGREEGGETQACYVLIFDGGIEWFGGSID
jgi:hypothetical protein